MDSKSPYDGSDNNGINWKNLIRGFLVGRVPLMRQLLQWAEDHGAAEIVNGEVEALGPYADESPSILSHLPWAFLGVNLTGDAREIFGNVPDSQGL